MIIPEERLDELFATLPVISYKGKDLKPVFNFGTRTDLNAFLADKRREAQFKKADLYPVVWLETPFTDTGSDVRITFPLVLILATLTNTDITNKDRLNDTFKLQLIPLFDNIKTALKSSGFTQVLTPPNRKSDEAFNITRYYNYGVKDDKQHPTSEIWDAMKIGCDLAMTDQCQREFNY